MRHIAFILAIHVAVCSTQPAWQPLKQAMFGSCGGSSCSVVAMTCVASPTLPGSPASGEDAQPTGCCVPFQCCFPCCCFCVKPEPLTLSHPATEKMIRPSEQTETLRSQCSTEHFQPPEMA
ncbi:MAG: hypothetical protein HY842_02080 [Bacteroidetes bacterium]|nr:hypothetical protein [Bacteroidota bacterium]